jgi:pimeloyl-ACP methyl ester carboxylesterase
VATPPLVLLPGMNCTEQLWQEVVPALPEVQVVHGELVEPDLDACVEDLLIRLPPRFALAGLSLGGIVAMALTRRAPERVERLALLDTNAKAPTDSQRQGWSSLLHRLEAGASAADVQRDLLPVLLGEGASRSVREVTVRMADALGVQRLAAQLRLQATRVDERPGLGRVRVPTLVLAGHDDALCPPSSHREIARLVPGSRLVLLERTGHLSPLERGAQVADELRAWLGLDVDHNHARVETQA